MSSSRRPAREGVGAYLDELRRDTGGYANRYKRLAGEARFWSMWASIPLPRKQAMIRARIDPRCESVAAGCIACLPTPSIRLRSVSRLQIRAGSGLLTGNARWRGRLR